MEFTVDQIAQLLGGIVKGNGSRKISMLAKIQDSNEGQLSFLSNPKYEQHLYDTEASAVIVSKDFEAKKEVSPTLILVDDPYGSFTVLLEEYCKSVSFQKMGVEELSYIGEYRAQASVGKSNPKGSITFMGSPAFDVKDNYKSYPLFKNLPDLSIRLKQLEEKVLNLACFPEKA